jgi:hypothetical protein
VKVFVAATPISGPERGADAIADAEHGRPTRARDAHRFERVGGLAALRYRDRQAIRFDDRIGIAEFGREFELDRKLCQLPDQVHAVGGRMIRRAAREHRDLLHLQEIAVRYADVADLHEAGLIDAAGERIADDFRLLVDLLEHEVLEAALFGGAHVPGHVGDFARDLLAVERRDLRAVARDDDDLAFLDDELLARVVENGWDI